MSQLVKIILIGLAIVSFSCTNRQEVDVEIDKTVMKEIFPALLDSMYVEILFAMLPPPIEKVFDSVSGETVLQPSAKNELFKEQIRNGLAAHNVGSTKTTIVLNDSIYPLWEDEMLKFQPKYLLSENYINKGYRIDLDAQIQTPGFQIVLSSLYKPTGEESDIVWKELSFSRIIFNKAQNRGMLTGAYVCGGLCGNGYRIFIKRDMTGKWSIDYIEHAWVA